MHPTTTRAQSLGQQGTATNRPGAGTAGPTPTASQPVQQQPQRPHTGDGLSHLFARCGPLFYPLSVTGTSSRPAPSQLPAAPR